MVGLDPLRGGTDARGEWKAGAPFHRCDGDLCQSFRFFDPQDLSAPDLTAIDSRRRIAFPPIAGSGSTAALKGGPR
jgi:hypothetical protein